MMKTPTSSLPQSARHFGYIFMVSLTVGAGLMTGVLCVAASLSVLLALVSR